MNGLALLAFTALGAALCGLLALLVMEYGKGKRNCHMMAWREFRGGGARYMCIRFTEYSRLVELTAKWWWWPLRVLGVGVQWIAWPMTHVGELMRTGRWYHATWMLPEGAHMEYVPEGEKRKRYVPPILFHGYTRSVEDQEWI